jgi:hypothetical protein
MNNVLPRTVTKALIIGLLLVSLTILILPASAAPTVYSGDITAESPIMTPDPSFCGRPSVPYAFGGVVTVGQTGSFEYNDFTFLQGGSYDTIMMLYTQPLDPGNTSANIYTQIDDSGSVTLNAGQVYYMYIVPYCSRTYGTYGFTFTGDSEIIISENGEVPVSGNKNPHQPADNDHDGYADSQDTCPAQGDEGYGVQGDGCPKDSRINWQMGDLGAVVYDHEDGVVVYCYDGSNTWLGMHISQAVVDNADRSQPQDVPVLEADGCNAAFYILDNGQFQINLWSSEGKLYELISDDLDFTDAVKRHFDPNE